MARATRCPQCGLMQMGMGARCKKCGAAFEVQSLSRASVAPAPAPAAGPPEINPYAPPTAAFGGAGFQAPEGVWRDGKTLVVSHDAEFPDRCVKCNQRADGYRLKRRLAWHPSGWYLLVLINLIVYAIVASIIQKKTTVYLGLCEAHRRRRQWLLGLGIAFPVLGIGACTATIQSDSAFVLGTVGTVIGIVLLILSTNVLSAESIDERFARIRGAHRNFLDSLPAFHR